MRAFVYLFTFGSWAALFLSGQCAAASLSHRQSATAYARAEKIHLRLEEKPVAARTRGDYERALDAYRAVYHGDPASPDAPRSIAEVADLLAGAGRCFHENKLLHDAVEQWEFLRKQYPASPLRQRALQEEAEIEQRDLHDRAAAKKIYREFLILYPRNDLAVEAREALRGATDTAKDELAHRLAVAPAEIPQSRPHSHPLAARAVSPAVQEAETAPPIATIHDLRYWAEGNSTRIAVDMSQSAQCRLYPAKNGRQVTLIFFGSHPTATLVGHSINVPHDANLLSMRVSMLTDNQTALVLELNRPIHAKYFSLSNPARLIVDLRPPAVATPMQTADTAPAPITPKDPASPKTDAMTPVSYQAATPNKTSPVREKPKTAVMTNELEDIAPATLSAEAQSPQPETNGQRSMMRVLGLRVRRIVIDAGHGGHDSGTLGPNGLEEKDVALDVALRLGHLLHQRLGAEVVYTRRTDKFVPLEERTAIANRAHADLFISIHANSSSDPEVRGVETYFLNFTASPDALAVAARENATSNRSVYELSDLVRKIALSDKIDESRAFAEDVQQSLYSGLAPGNPGMKNRGVKQAPFVVLIGANMPSILAEISFLTNPTAARELRRPAYRERLAEALYRGVADYVEGMSGIRVAKTTDPAPLSAPAE